MNKNIKILLAIVSILIISNIIILYLFVSSKPFGKKEFYKNRIKASNYLRGKDPAQRKKQSELRKCFHHIKKINRKNVKKLHHFDKLLHEELIKETPDKIKIMAYIDSTQNISSKMKKSTVKYFLENHDSLSIKQKRMILKSLLKKHLPKKRKNKH